MQPASCNQGTEKKRNSRLNGNCLGYPSGVLCFSFDAVHKILGYMIWTDYEMKGWHGWKENCIRKNWLRLSD